MRYWMSARPTSSPPYAAFARGPDACTAARGSIEEDGMEALMERLLEPPPEAPEPALPPETEPAARVLRLRTPKRLSQ